MEKRNSIDKLAFNHKRSVREQWFGQWSKSWQFYPLAIEKSAQWENDYLPPNAIHITTKEQTDIH